MTRSLTEIHRTAGLVAIIAASLLGSAGVASAEGFTAEQRAACTPDAFRLCASEIPNVPAIAACMRKNRASLSSACKAVFPK
jgi:hypothetical protein